MFLGQEVVGGGGDDLKSLYAWGRVVPQKRTKVYKGGGRFQN